jgi:hypothetical protein
MRIRNRLERFLRTPRGVLWLLALTLALSAATAVGIALQRDFFERHIHASERRFR